MRALFRVLLFATLLVLVLGRVSGGRLLPAFIIGPFVTWFSVSVFVFGIFGIRAAWLAWRDPANRKAYMLDVVLAAAWIPYWFINLNRK
jgi:choline-glycine betaine transporter